MIVFKTIDNEFEKIEGNIFKKLTKEKEPYYQIGKDGKMRYYAICPECNNTINIINLFNDKLFIEENKKPSRTHGKHCTADIKGFKKFDEIAYKKCSLSNSKKNQGNRQEVLLKKENEIKNILDNYSEELRKAIQRITGINISVNIFEKMKKSFKLQDGHLYRYINIYNLPYTFLYFSGNTYIVNQYLKKEHYLSNKIVKAIEENSLFFKIENNQILKTKDEKITLEMRFEEHLLVNNNDFESMEMVIEENGSQIFREKLIVDDFSFIKTIKNS